MKYVDWCHHVLDRIVDAHNSDRKLRFTGFVPEQAVAWIFPNTLMNQESTQFQGVRSALFSLKELGTLTFLDQFAPEKDLKYVLTKQGSAGSSRLIEHWWSYYLDLDEDELTVFQGANALSQRVFDDHSTVEAVKVSDVIESIGWQQRSAEAEAYLGADHGPNQLPHLRTNLVIGSDLTIPACAATYESLLFHTHQSLVAESRTKFNNKYSTVNFRTHSINLTLIRDDRLRSGLEADYEEAQRCISVNAFKATSILFAGILEGLLYDFCTHSVVAKHPLYLAAQNDMQGKRNWKRWDWRRISISQFIDLTSACNVFSDFEASLLHSIKALRDTVHPLAGLEYENIVSSNQAILLLNAIETIQSSLLKWVSDPPIEEK